MTTTRGCAENLIGKIVSIQQIGVAELEPSNCRILDADNLGVIIYQDDTSPTLFLPWTSIQKILLPPVGHTSIIPKQSKS